MTPEVYMYCRWLCVHGMNESVPLAMAMADADGGGTAKASQTALAR